MSKGALAKRFMCSKICDRGCELSVNEEKYKRMLEELMELRSLG